MPAARRDAAGLPPKRRAGPRGPYQPRGAPTGDLARREPATSTRQPLAVPARLEKCLISRVELIPVVDPTGDSSLFLATYYCIKGDAGNCAINAVALVPFAGGVLKDVSKGGQSRC